MLFLSFLARNFAPLILGGYVFGARFGFLFGAFALLVSALITGGVGPWLPYQMFAAGWMGLSAGGLGVSSATAVRVALLHLAKPFGVALETRRLAGVDLLAPAGGWDHVATLPARGAPDNGPGRCR